MVICPKITRHKDWGKDESPCPVCPVCPVTLPFWAVCRAYCKMLLLINDLLNFIAQCKVWFITFQPKRSVCARVCACKYIWWICKPGTPESRFIYRVLCCHLMAIGCNNAGVPKCSVISNFESKEHTCRFCFKHLGNLHFKYDIFDFKGLWYTRMCPIIPYVSHI